MAAVWWRTIADIHVCVAAAVNLPAVASSVVSRPQPVAVVVHNRYGMRNSDVARVFCRNTCLIDVLVAVCVFLLYVCLLLYACVYASGKNRRWNHPAVCSSAIAEAFLLVGVGAPNWITGSTMQCSLSRCCSTQSFIGGCYYCTCQQPVCETPFQKGR